MVGPGEATTIATAIQFFAPVRPLPMPLFVRREIVLLWTLGIFSLCLGLAALVAIAASSTVRRHWYAMTPLAVAGLLALLMGTGVLTKMA